MLDDVITVKHRTWWKFITTQAIKNVPLYFRLYKLWQFIAFDNFGTIGNRNECSTKMYKLCHFNLTTISLYLIKLKIAQKRPTAYAMHSVKPIVSNFRRKSFNVCVSFLICYKIRLADKKSFTFSWVLSKIYLQTQYG